jgi:hypothetical protein
MSCGDAMTCWSQQKKYSKRKGLDGPFAYPNGRVLYFDRKENEYWDPTTDFFVPEHEVNELKQSLFNIVGGNYVR